MKIHRYFDRKNNGAAAAAFGATQIRNAISENGEASIIVATGVSQFDMIEALLEEKDITWSRVTAFHLDEYIGIPVSHPASFRKYLWERFHRRLPEPLRAFHYVSGEDDAWAECRRLGALIARRPIDVCFAGIGENAHLAFNDPPADFETEDPYLVVDLDQACRQQQFGEGWFATREEVPRQAISMSIRQILKSRCIIVTAPDERKARAVKESVEGKVTRQVPSSILQRHSNAHIYLDTASASLLSA